MFRRRNKLNRDARKEIRSSLGAQTTLKPLTRSAPPDRRENEIESSFFYITCFFFLVFEAPFNKFQVS